MLDIICTIALKRYRAKKWHFAVHPSPVFQRIGVHGSKTKPPSRPQSGYKLCNKNKDTKSGGGGRL